MKSKAWVKEIIINDGTRISLDSNDIVVIVGPNNAGKSALLKEINTLLQNNLSTNSIIIKSLTYNFDGSREDLMSFLKENSDEYFHAGSERPYYRGLRFNFHESNVKDDNVWNNITLLKKGLSSIHPIFVNLLNTQERLSSSKPPENISLINDAPKHAIHYLQRDDKLELDLSDYFRQAFGADLVLHRNAGKFVPLYVGDRPKLEENEHRSSLEYLKKIEKLTELQFQGDGMRSFVGIVLNTFTSNHSVLLIDEPEAFLHPPQARLIGKMLAKELKSERQLFISTHSEELLKGILESKNRNVKIIRVKRDGNINRINELKKEHLQTFWKDSLLRYSNVLNGLFHSRVIICESDSDCRFYSAMLNAICENEDKFPPDYLFVHCGGKHRIPQVIGSLFKLGVPVTAIVDFDILNDENPLKQIINNLGGDFEIIKDKWKTVKDSIDKRKPELERKDFIDDINQVTESIPDKIVSKEKIKEIEKLLKKASPWSFAKEQGRGFIPSGTNTSLFDQLTLYCSDIGLEIVPDGEIESFAQSIGGHGPKWVNTVLEKDLINDPELESARKFIKRLI